ncbi:MAG: hypothetical protein ACI9DF_001398 [Verrucomicrobiales bacterium]|jgi:hypothetical protein
MRGMERSARNADDPAASKITTTSFDRRVMVSMTGTEAFRSEALPFILENNGQIVVQRSGDGLMAVSDWSVTVYLSRKDAPEAYHQWQAHLEKWDVGTLWFRKKADSRLAMVFSANSHW